jgi:hypothetical protein
MILRSEGALAAKVKHISNESPVSSTLADQMLSSLPNSLEDLVAPALIQCALAAQDLLRSSHFERAVARARQRQRQEAHKRMEGESHPRREYDSYDYDYEYQDDWTPTPKKGEATQDT